MAACEGEWLHRLAPEELDEIGAAVRAHMASGLAMGAVSPESFPLPRPAPVLERVKRGLLDGRGFAVLRGLPVERWTTEEGAVAYLGIGGHLRSFAQRYGALTPGDRGRIVVRDTVLTFSLEPG